MSTYHYKCQECEHEFEIKQSIHDDALKTCPECKKDSLSKVIGANCVIFKGRGWMPRSHRRRY